MLTQEQIDYVYENVGWTLSGLWSCIGNIHEMYPLEEDPASFERKKEDFLFIMGKLLR